MTAIHQVEQRVRFTWAAERHAVVYTLHRCRCGRTWTSSGRTPAERTARAAAGGREHACLYTSDVAALYRPVPDLRSPEGATPWPSRRTSLAV